MLGDDELGKTRGQTQQQAEESTEVKTPEKPKLPRDSTMVVTAKVSIKFEYIALKVNCTFSITWYLILMG